jgi:diacylglycerol kinase (ATP)
MKIFKIFKNVFRLHSLKESFSFAIKGIAYLFFFHRNMRIIFLVGIASFLLGIYLKITGFEFMILCVTISMVFVAEMFNTAIELIIDMFTDKYHVLLKIIKDISAGVVLIASLNALAIGYFIFFRRIFHLLHWF